MATIDERARLVSIKAVVAGQACSGKAAILRAVAERYGGAPVHEGRVGSVRVLRTEFLWPRELESGWRLRVRLFAPTGADAYNAVEELLVREADGAVFVVDVDPEQEGNALESLQRLAFNVRRTGWNLGDLPVALQYHRAERHPDFEPERMDECLGVPTGSVPRFVTTSERGDGEGLAVDTVISQIVQRLELAVPA